MPSKKSKKPESSSANRSSKDKIALHKLHHNSNDDVYFATPEEEAKSMQTLREMIDNCRELDNANITEDLLLRCLWCKRNDSEKAFNLIKSYASWNNQLKGCPSKRLSIKDVHHIQMEDILSLPGIACKDGNPVLLMKVNKYKPNDIPYQAICQSLSYLIERITEDERASKYGITFLGDMSDWGWSHFGMPYASSFFNTIQNRFPLRIRKFILVDLPKMFPMVFKMIKPMLSAELASKFIFTTRDTIDDHFHGDSVIDHFGGVFSPVKQVDFIKDRYEKEGIEYTEQSSKVNWDDYKSSFRVVDLE